MTPKKGKSLTDEEYERWFARYMSMLPPGTRVGFDETGECMTFGFPIERLLPGWIAVLRFLGRSGAVDLASVEISYFADPVPPRPPRGANLMVDGLRDPAPEELAALRSRYFGEWVQERALRPVPTGVPDGGLVITRLRDVRIGDFQSAARRYMKSGDVAPTLPAAWGAEAQRRPGMPGKNDLHFALLAEAYVEIGGRARVAALVDRYNINKSTVRNQLAEARARGLLTSPGRGRAGGRLTDKARTILNEQKGGM